MSEKNAFLKEILYPVRVAGLFILLIWIIALYQYISGDDLGRFGLYPRTQFGLKGILTTPFLHGDLAHAASNTAPLFVTICVLFLFYQRIAWQSLLMMYIGTGVLMWIFARPAYHVGASGVVYALVAFIAWTGIFRRNVKTIALALFTVVLYGPMIAGIFPLKETISWEGHLMGGIVGIYTAFIFRHEWEQDEKVQQPAFEKEEKKYFLPRDTFDKTMAERAEEERLDQQQNNYWNLFRNSDSTGFPPGNDPQ